MCRTFCDDIKDRCDGYYNNAIENQFTCTNGKLCYALFENHSDKLFADCSYSTDKCEFTVIDSDNYMISTAENIFIVDRWLDCSFAMDCKLTATNT